MRQQAIGFLRRTRTTWFLVHSAIVKTCCAQLACNAAKFLARAQKPYLIRLVQAQYQHLALGAQLIAAARHESSLLGAAGPSFVQSLRRMRRTLIAFIQNVRPRIDSDAASRDFGIVPVAPLIAAYIAHSWRSRGAPLGAPRQSTPARRPLRRSSAPSSSWRRRRLHRRCHPRSRSDTPTYTAPSAYMGCRWASVPR